jgi:hypothetical protein
MAASPLSAWRRQTLIKLPDARDLRDQSDECLICSAQRSDDPTRRELERSKSIYDAERVCDLLTVAGIGIQIADSLRLDATATVHGQERGTDPFSRAIDNSGGCVAHGCRRIRHEIASVPGL